MRGKVLQPLLQACMPTGLPNFHTSLHVYRVLFIAFDKPVDVDAFAVE